MSKKRSKRWRNARLMKGAGVRESYANNYGTKKPKYASGRQWTIWNYQINLVRAIMKKRRKK